VKVLADGFGTLYKALEGVELAFLRTDRHKWLAVVDAEELLELLAAQKRAPKSPTSEAEHVQFPSGHM